MAPRKPKFDAPSAPSVTGTVDAQVSPAPETRDVKIGKFVGKNFSFFHPFQKVQIPMGGSGVTLELDSWLKCQIDAGLIVKL